MTLCTKSAPLKRGAYFYQYNEELKTTDDAFRIGHGADHKGRAICAVTDCVNVASGVGNDCGTRRELEA